MILRGEIECRPDEFARVEHLSGVRRVEVGHSGQVWVDNKLVGQEVSVDHSGDWLVTSDGESRWIEESVTVTYQKAL